MVDDEVQRTREYREVALKLRALARQTRSPEAQRRLLDLAERFEQLAAGGEDGSSPA